VGVAESSRMLWGGEFRGESDKAFLTTFELFFANQQNLKFINAQFFAQTLGTVSRHWNNPLK
jgi:hypothetical protein